MSTDVITNSEKHENYREQMSRLTKAMKSQFYLEAVFIEYAVIEDRLTSILRYTNDFNAEKHNTITKKLSKLESIQRDKNGILKNYISDELISEIHEWKNNRNTIVHWFCICRSGKSYRSYFSKRKSSTLNQYGIA